jgi:hypothetical protein
LNQLGCGSAFREWVTYATHRQHCRFLTPLKYLLLCPTKPRVLPRGRTAIPAIYRSSRTASRRDSERLRAGVEGHRARAHRSTTRDLRELLRVGQESLSYEVKQA